MRSVVLWTWWVPAGLFGVWVLRKGKGEGDTGGARLERIGSAALASIFNSIARRTLSQVWRNMYRARSIVPNRFDTIGNRQPFTLAYSTAGPP